MNYCVGIGEYIIIDKPDSQIMTHALGSCVAVIFYCSEKKIAAMIHIALPKKLEKTSNSYKLGYYADQGLPIIIKQLEEKCGCKISSMKVDLFGGAKSIRENDSFKIGEKNLYKIKNMLKDRGIRFNDEHVGGNISRTVSIDVETGKLKVITNTIII